MTGSQPSPANLLSTLDEAIRSSAVDPFDVVVIGGGTFGSALATRLVRGGRGLRVLILEGGPFLLADHVHNRSWEECVDMPGPGGTFRDDQELSASTIWRRPWKSNVAFPGLAYCLGGRSIYHGGWCPRPIDSEVSEWPREAVRSLRDQYWPLAMAALGTGSPNDFVWCELHDRMQGRLFAAVSGMRSLLSVASPGDLEAPLALRRRDDESSVVRKFNPLPELFAAAAESEQLDGHSALVVVPTHVVHSGRGRATDGGVVPMTVVDVDPGVKSASALAF
jgi:choline dehydrogenase-like flavoprotein